MYLVWIIGILIQQQAACWLTFFSGTKGFQSVGVDRVVMHQLFPGWKYFLCCCDATDVGLVAGANVVSDALHEGGFVGKNPYFCDFCIIFCRLFGHETHARQCQHH